jgi:hypothetical protein
MFKRAGFAAALFVALVSVYASFYVYSPVKLDLNATFANLKQYLNSNTSIDSTSPTIISEMSALRSVSRQVAKKVFAHEQEEVRL